LCYTVAEVLVLSRKYFIINFGSNP
jgi:hypothetical protein